MEQHFEELYPDTARAAEIEKIIGFVKDGNSCQLIGIPGGGRSTVLGLLANNKKVRLKHLGNVHANTHFAQVNFLEIRRRPLYDATKFLFLSLSDSLRNNKNDYEKINGIFKKSLGFSDELVLFQGLKEAVDYLCLERKLKLVFLFDRFEEYIPTVASGFFTNLRALRGRAKYQFSVVFSVIRPLEVTLEPGTFADFYEFTAGHYIYPELYDKVTTEARVGYMEKVTGKKISPALLAQVVKETGGVGRLIKLSVEALLAHDFQSRHPGKRSASWRRAHPGSLPRRQAGRTDVNGEILDTARMTNKELSDFLYSQKPIQAALSGICSALSPAEQAALIKGKYDDEAITDYLEGVGIIKDSKIQIPLFERHIGTHIGQFEDKTEKIFYDEATNIIQKADLVLSDQLTSSEFRLLRFFLQTSDKIIERDALIGVVWPDVKSTAGITDQAVDQLIFRLRRKIENDPNKPTHLMTVKGRGFRFVA